MPGPIFASDSQGVERELIQHSRGVCLLVTSCVSPVSRENIYRLIGRFCYERVEASTALCHFGEAMGTLSEHILVVDDDPEIGELLGDILTREQYRVSRAGDTAEARGNIAVPYTHLKLQTNEQG